MNPITSVRLAVSKPMAALWGTTQNGRFPGVDFDLTRPTVLAMDYLDGIPLEELCGSRHSQADRDRMGTLLLRLLMTELFEVQFVQSDPNFANFLLMPGGGLGLVDLGAGRPVPDSLSRGYALICKASLEGDRAGLQHAAEALGILASGAPPRWVEAVTEILEMVGEPFRAQGAYDFGATNLPERAREAGLKLAFESNMGGLPPGELLFLQRKLGGIFLLCARLGARVDVRKIGGAFCKRRPPGFEYMTDCRAHAPARVVIQGASGGLGFALAKSLLCRPGVERVVLTARDPFASQGLQDLVSRYPKQARLVALDVTQEDSLAAASEVVEADLGLSVDLAICCAGLLHHPDGLAPEKRIETLSSEKPRTSISRECLRPSAIRQAFLAFCSPMESERCGQTSRLASEVSRTTAREGGTPTGRPRRPRICSRGPSRLRWHAGRLS